MNARRTRRTWPRTCRTSDGLKYRVRLIRPDDVQRERAFIAGLSDRSRYQRFMHVLGEPSAEMIDALVNVDGHLRVALVATVGEGDTEIFIGVARYAADPDGTACEFAIAVADAWQCRGIGTTLAPLLFEYAASQGFRTIYGYVLADNARMLDLVDFLGLTIDAQTGDRGMVRAWRTLR